MPYLWDPDKEQQADVAAQLRQRARNRRQGVRTTPPSIVRNAATGTQEMLPGGTGRVHTAPAADGLAGGVTGGLAQMLAQQGGDSEIVDAAAQIEDVPGGKELLYTVAAEELMKSQGIPAKKAQKIRLYCMGGPVKAYAKGGSAEAAERTRRAGRDEDEMLVHMTKDEFDVIRSMWGEPDTNPNTGMPEYGWLKKAWKKVKKTVKKIVKSPIFRTLAPVALSVFAPGIGTAIGAKLGLSGAAASMAGNAIVQGGLGAVTGGKEGALTGALSGAVTGGLGKALGSKLGLSGKTADVVGSALVRGTGSAATGRGFVPGAVSGGLQSFLEMRPEQVAGKIRSGLGPGGVRQAFTGLAKGQAGPPLPALRGALNVARKVGVPLAGSLLMGSTLSGDSFGGGAEEVGGPPGLPAEFTGTGGFGGSGTMPVTSMNRRFQGLPNEGDYFTYGQAGSPYSGQQLFMEADPFAQPTGPGGLPLSFEQLQGKAEGGLATYWEQNEDVANTIPTVSKTGGRHVKGPGSGRSDDIPAVLSDGEYVIDAESVALLGDGSGNAGARRLDEMRKNLRKHKGKNLSKGGFSHKAKTPDQYMNRLRRKAKYEYGGGART